MEFEITRVDCFYMYSYKSGLSYGFEDLCIVRKGVKYLEYVKCPEISKTYFHTFSDLNCLYAFFSLNTI